ncbi:MAG TPA: hemerythrin domain-containing protein [Solimonas sp.]|nr:hemerythrin domain-containing protein [Solimonas sp.]
MLKNIIRKFDPEPDAISLLKEDHRKVEALFAEFDATDDKRMKGSIARKICDELDVHAKIEEKLFYPAAKRDKAEEVQDAVNEGFVEHEGIKRLIKEIQGMTPGEEFFETRLKVLKEYVRHHIKEEEHSMFPKVIESEIDLKALGQKLAQLKEKLQAESEPKPARRAPRAKPAAKTRRRVAEPA